MLAHAGTVIILFLKGIFKKKTNLVENIVKYKLEACECLNLGWFATKWNKFPERQKKTPGIKKILLSIPNRFFY